MSILKLDSNLELSPDKIYYYGGALSNNCMRVTLHLAEKGVNWESLKIDVLNAKNLEEDYLKIHPKGTVPAIIHNGLAISDSNDIMKYIEDKFPSPSLLPRDSNEVDEMWEHVDRAANIHPKMAKAYFYSLGVGRPCTEKSLKRYKEINPELYEFHKKYGKKMSKQQVLDVLEFNRTTINNIEELLENNKYLLGETYTLADIAWASNLFFLEAFKFDLSAYPKVRNWMERIRKRDAYNQKTRIPNIPMFVLRIMKLILSLRT